MRTHRASRRGELGTPELRVSLSQPGGGQHALPRFPNIRPTPLHPLLRRRARGGRQRDGLGYRLWLPFAGEKQLARPVPTAWHRRSPQRWSVSRLGLLRHPGTATAVLHPCLAAGTGMGLCRPGSEASCQAGCSIQFALIWQSGSGSHAPKPIRAAVAGGSQPRGVLPSQCPGLEERGRLVLRTAQPRCRRVKPSPGRVPHGATLPSRSRDAAWQPLDRCASGRGTRGLCARIPQGCAAGLTAPFTRSLGIVESAAGCRKECGGEGAGPACRGQHKARLCCWGDALPSLPSAPAWLPALPGAEGRRGKLLAGLPSQHPHGAGALSPCPASPRPEQPQPLRRRSQAPIKTTFYSFPPS